MRSANHFYIVGGSELRKGGKKRGRKKERKGGKKRGRKKERKEERKEGERKTEGGGLAHMTNENEMLHMCTPTCCTTSLPKRYPAPLGLMPHPSMSTQRKSSQVD